MATAMENMPGEILLHVCSYLADTHSASLLAFSLVNRRCFSLAKSLLFRTVKFELRTHDGLVRDVQECQNLLERNASFVHVRRLVVDMDLGPDRPFNPDYQWQRPRITVDDEYGEQLKVETKEHYFHGYTVGDDLVRDWPEASAQSLARLIERLSLLSDFVYGPPSKFPRWVLHALHRYQPQCRLRIKRFMLRSLNAPVMDPDEFMLVTSPCLYAIKIGYGCAYYHKTEPPKEHDYNQDAAMSLVANQAPRLTEVRVWPRFCPSGYIPPPASWKGFPVDEETKSKMNSFALGSLQMLHLDGLTPHSLGKDTSLQRWALHTDFSVLRVLELTGAVEHEALEFLANCKLPSLVHLTLTFRSNSGSDYYETLGCFLSSLSAQLTGLILRNWLPPCEPGGMTFGPKLRKLGLHSEGGSLQPESIAHLAECSPLIEDLCLHVLRSKGDAAEVACYRDLGRFRRLRHLTLFLDTATPWDPDDCWQHSKHSEDKDPDLHDDPPVYGPHEPDPWSDPKGTARARDMLVNYAVDEDLARAIFEVISSAQSRYAAARATDDSTLQTASSSSPLLSLQLFPIVRSTQHYFFYNNSFADDVGPYLKRMQRNWLVERSTCQGHAEDALLVRPIGLNAEDRHSRSSQPLLPICELSSVKVVEDAFRRLWPWATESGWENQWRSWPLADVEYEDEEDGRERELLREFPGRLRIQKHTVVDIR